MIIALFICFLGSAIFSGKLPEYRFSAGPGAATGVPNRDLKSRYHFADIFEAIIRFLKRSLCRKTNDNSAVYRNIRTNRYSSNLPEKIAEPRKQMNRANIGWFV